MFPILCYIPFILIFPCLSDGKRRQFGSSSMPPSLLKASPLAMNHLKKVSANILLSYLVALCLWPGRCRCSSAVLAMGVMLPEQEIPPQGKRGAAWQREGTRGAGCSAGEGRGVCFNPKTSRFMGRTSWRGTRIICRWSCKWATITWYLLHPPVESPACCCQ